MFAWFRGRRRTSGDVPPPPEALPPASPYIQEFLAAIDRTEAFGLSAPPRVLVAKDCVDMGRTMPVLLDYFDRHRPEELVGQTAAIHFALVPLLMRKTGIPFQLTIGWMVRDGRAIFQHDEDTIRRFLAHKLDAWTREGMPFHLWLTSPACEVLDVTFAMNLGWAKTRERCEQLVIYKPAHAPPGKNVYHPMLVGPEFFVKSGAVL
jgi:hypothetical protein